MSILKEYKCDSCKELFNYEDEMVFDGDELTEPEEGWSTCECIECYTDNVDYEEDNIDYD
jgi:hypothetical protein